MGYSGYAARGAQQGLEDLLASTLQRELMEAEAQQRADQGRRADRQMNLQERSFDAEQAANERELQIGEEANRAAQEKGAYEQTARANMSEMVGDPNLQDVLASFSMASGVEVPSTVRELTKPVPKKFRSVTVRGPKGEPLERDIEEGSEEAIKGVEKWVAPKESAQPREGKWEWVMRDGKPVRVRGDQPSLPGDEPMRTGAGGGAGGGGNAQTATTNAMATLSKLDELSKSINTGTGPMARVSGWAREGASLVGMDDKVTEYEGIIGLTLPMLARELGHVGVLTQQDVDSVLKGLPKITSTKGERDLLIGNIKELIGRRVKEYEARTGERLDLGGGLGGDAAGQSAYAEYLKRRGGKR